jgi:hypothetical protein
MMKTIKKRLNHYTKKYVDGLGSCLFLEFTFVSLQVTYNLHNTLAWKGKLSILKTCVGPILNAY